VQLVCQISNLCDPDKPTSQTDRQTDGRRAISIPLYALVHGAVKKISKHQQQRRQQRQQQQQQQHQNYHHHTSTTTWGFYLSGSLFMSYCSEEQLSKTQSTADCDELMRKA